MEEVEHSEVVSAVGLEVAALVVRLVTVPAAQTAVEAREAATVGMAVDWVRDLELEAEAKQRSARRSSQMIASAQKQQIIG